MDKSIHSLHLMDDPVSAVTWMLRQLPLDTCATCLAMILAEAVERGTVTSDDYSRIKRLVDDILSIELYRAA